MIVNGNLTFHTLGLGQLKNAILENFTTAGRDALAGGDLVSGRLIYNTTTNELNWYDGTNWQVFAGVSTGGLFDEVNAIESASGGIFDTDGTYDSSVLNSLNNVTASTDLANALSQLDNAISDAANIDTLGELTDTAANIVTSGVLGDILYIDIAGSRAANTGMVAEPNDNDLLQWTIDDTWAPTSPSVIASSISLDDLNDIDDSSTHAIDTAYIFVGDGTNLDVTEVTTSAPANFIETIEDVVGAMVTGSTQTDITVTYDDGNNEIDFSVNDSYLRNNGDTLDSGTLTIATGADLTIIDTPLVGTDAANKDYVDSVAAGLDPKESVRLGTTGALPDTPTYDNGTGGVGATLTGTGITVLTVDGTSPVNDDRILIKDQATTLQNGIYVVTNNDGVSSWILTRSEDQNGSPSNEVSGGNHTFVESGTTNEDTGWVVVFDGNIVVGTDPIIWSKFTGAGSFNAEVGIGQDGSDIFLQTDELITAVPITTDFLIFADQSETSTTTSNDRKVTINDFITTFDILTSDTGVNAITGSNGILISGQDAQLDIVGLTALGASPDGTDLIAIYDDSAGAHRKVTITELGTGGANSTSNLTDVTLAATAEGHILVANSSFDYVPRHISFIQTQNTASSTWTVTHNLGQQFCNVTVYNSSNQVIIPQSITATDTNTTTITFSSAISGTAVIIGVAGSAGVII